MKPIKKLKAIISEVIDLSPTAREIIFTLPEPLDYEAGCFFNLFMEKDGEKIRRAFSISLSDESNKHIHSTIRLTPEGAITPLFWKDDIVGTEVEIMAPLGMNTADKMLSPHIYLFGFGVGAGVVRSLAKHFAKQTNIESLTIMTGSRSVEEIIHKDFFDDLAAQHPHVSVEHVVSENDTDTNYKTGYIQNHLSELDFNNSDVYVCGQEAACNQLVETVKSQQPNNCNFLIEGFH